MKTETKNETKHTPGPWRMNGTAIEAPCTGGVTASRYHYHIANVPDDLNNCEEVDWRANARLIAAAPELLAACKTVVGFYRQFSRLTHDEQAVCDAVSQAVKKAEGK